MSDPFVPRVGGILSADIAVPEHEREVNFYSRVLTTGENPLWRKDLLNNLGTPIIGLGASSPDYENPTVWNLIFERTKAPLLRCDKVSPTVLGEESKMPDSCVQTRQT